MSKRVRPTFKECMVAATAPVVQRRLVQPWQKLYRGATRTNFGDEKLKAKSVMPRVFLRFMLVLPVGAVGTALCATIIGLPLGIPLLLWVGAFISKPIRQHPAFNVNARSEETGDDD